MAVVCFGARTNIHGAWSAFSESLESTREFDLLIITQPDAKYNDHTLYEKIARLTPSHIQLFSIAHRLSAVIHAAKHGHEFFVHVLRCGKALYNLDNTIESIPLNEVQSSLTHKQSLWNHYSNLAAQFLAGARYHKSNRHYALALFDLHQVVEHASTAIVYWMLGYRATTHSLKQSLSLVKLISKKPVEAFPQCTNEDKRLFNLLAKAYSDARYQVTFHVNPTDVEIIVNRVENFLDAILTLYMTRSHEPMFIENELKTVL